MRVRLFWQLLATFGLLIVFAIGATTALNRATFRGAAFESFHPAWQERNSAWIERWTGLPPSPTAPAPLAPVEPLEAAGVDPTGTVGERVDRSLGLVALAIGSVTFGLAVLMSGRISAPLAGLTRAARQIAAGSWDARVPSSSISEVDALARAFNQMATDLQRADQLRRNMTADIAHELRTPLTIIKGQLEGILDGVYPSTPEHIMPVLEEANLLERLIDDLRLLSLAEAGQLPLHRDEVAVAGLLEDVRRTFAAEAAQQDVALHVDAAADIGPLMVDPQRMQQVLGNLVANSLRHTPAGGRIDLRAGGRDGVATIAVADTGSGIAPDDVPHIFDRFWRGDKARPRSGTSAGLGLAIARQLVEAHGGRISAASELGRGTTITMEIPRHTAVPARETRSGAPASSIRS